LHDLQSLQCLFIWSEAFDPNVRFDDRQANIIAKFNTWVGNNVVLLFFKNRLTIAFMNQRSLVIETLLCFQQID